MTINNESSSFAKTSRIYVVMSVVLSLGLVISSGLLQTTSYAAELNPSDTINPTKSEPSLKNHPEASVIKRDDKRVQSTKVISDKVGSSWWNWLTNSSSKPAYFHYVDMLELLD
ncbi:MAG: hypothetical protein COA74_16235 [Gammaproteobacteria bacterium]|nr:MAG: hypothetical protein COA74_16235 [Gammaproteobacteria bacterium]